MSILHSYQFPLASYPAIEAIGYYTVEIDTRYAFVLHRLMLSLSAYAQVYGTIEIIGLIGGVARCAPTPVITTPPTLNEEDLNDLFDTVSSLMRQATSNQKL